MMKQMKKMLAFVLIFALTLGLGSTFMATTITAEDAAEEATEESTEETTEKAADKSADKSTEKSADKNAEKSAKDSPKESKKEPADSSDAIQVLALKGPTAMGLASWFDEAGDEAWPAVDYEILASPDLLAPEIAKGNYDLALMPGNLAAKLYKKTEGDLRFMALSTLSVLHICETGDTIKTLDDLSGKTIVLSGKGATPDLLIQRIIDEAGLKDVTLEYVPEHQAVVQALADDGEKIALLPEPFVTIASAKIDNLHIALAMTDLWTDVMSDKDKGETPAQIVQGVLVARTEWLKENPELAKEALDAFKRSTEIALEEPEVAAKAIANLDLFPYEIALKALPNCGLAAESDEDAQTTFQDFLEALDDSKLPLPDEEFYENGIEQEEEEEELEKAA